MEKSTVRLFPLTFAIGGLLAVSSMQLQIAQPASAHEVETSAEMGGTLHMEPNDTPRANQPSLAWIALTRKGGTVVPLSDCRCHLAIYTDPHSEGAAPVAEPTLRPVSAEGYQQLPGADVVFPAVGTYTLVLTGEPVAPAEFEPFELSFDVTVAAGVAAPIASPDPAQSSPEAATPTPGAAEPSAPTPAPAPSPAPSPSGRWWLPLGIGLAVGVGLLGVGQRFLRGK